jgi:hypothetical protein
MLSVKIQSAIVDISTSCSKGSSQATIIKLKRTIVAMQLLYWTERKRTERRKIASGKLLSRKNYAAAYLEVCVLKGYSTQAKRENVSPVLMCNGRRGKLWLRQGSKSAVVNACGWRECPKLKQELTNNYFVFESQSK